MSDLEVHALRKSYPTPSEPLVILDGIDLELSKGESLAIVGPSGSGKSTLLSILGTLDEPTEGEFRLSGVDPFELNEAELAKFRAEQIGFVFQEHHLLPQCTAIENVLLPLLADGKVSQEDEEHAQGLLDRVGLSDRTTHRPAQLSGGERQRVAIARALIREPLLLLADEPTGNLDAESASAVADMLMQLQEERSGILITVTHSMSLADRMNRRLNLQAGQLLSV